MSYTGYGNSGFDLDSPGQVNTYDKNYTGASGAYDDYNPKPQTYDEIPSRYLPSRYLRTFVWQRFFYIRPSFLEAK